MFAEVFDSDFPSEAEKETRSPEAGRNSQLPLQFLERIFLSTDLNSSSLLQQWCTFPYPSVSQTADNKLERATS